MTTTDKKVRHLEIDREMDNHAHYQGDDSAYNTWLYGVDEVERPINEVMNDEEDEDY